ncbi:class I SAM-dependent methyltransferase [Phenylobacterium immobile]|uniref:class I SAM-dependent methyltransferase n=1 Tax=Phenylobacterium immobile TaxID=21 RepID=UPI000A8FE56B|nr:class I SAM-dependent methyltransferase [Phenylobacterium immobile]
MAHTRPYYAQGGLSAAYYDLLTSLDPTVAADIDVYADLAAPGADLLELGAGSGRLTFALAERGFSVTGVDIAPAMLDLARARLATVDATVAARITLKLGDLTALHLGRTFDAVFCPFHTLAHVPAGQAWRNAFATTAKHLRPGGLAAFHLPSLDVMAALPPVNPTIAVLDQATPDGGRLQLFVRDRTFRPTQGRLDQVIEYRATDLRGATRISAERLVFYMTQPDPFAAAAGLVADRPPAPMGEAGAIHIFRKT